MIKKVQKKIVLKKSGPRGMQFKIRSSPKYIHDVNGVNSIEDNFVVLLSLTFFRN
jgi:hypothetical protein